MNRPQNRSDRLLGEALVLGNHLHEGAAKPLMLVLEIREDLLVVRADLVEIKFFIRPASEAPGKNVDALNVKTGSGCL